MSLYEEIFEHAARKFSNLNDLELMLPSVRTDEQLLEISDAEYLSVMTRRIFQAGMTHSVINNKWDHFEKVFWGFDPNKLVLVDDRFMEQAMQDAGLIRHWAKLKTIPVNAMEMNQLAADAGSFGQFIVGWEGSVVDLWKALAKRFKRMGGNSSPYFLRMVGKDTFVLTNDVVSKLISLNIIDSKPTSKADLILVEQVFMGLRQESGRSYAHLSKLLALSLE